MFPLAMFYIISAVPRCRVVGTLCIHAEKKMDSLDLSSQGRATLLKIEKNLFLSAAKHVRRILESALLCGFYEFLHRSKFAVGQLGGCGLNETTFWVIRFEFKL